MPMAKNLVELRDVYKIYGEGLESEEIPEGFWAVPVEIGISDNSNVEIKSGVEEGTEVFTQIQSLQAWG